MAFCAANVHDISRTALCIFLLIVLPFCSPFTVCAIEFCLSEDSREQARDVILSTLGSQVSHFQLADE